MKTKYNIYLPAIVILSIIFIVLFIFIKKKLNNNNKSFYNFIKESVLDGSAGAGAGAGAGNRSFPEKTKVFYINLDKNVKRNDELIQSYNASDLKVMPLNRFSAILGKTVDLDKWLTPDALMQLQRTEKTKRRTHHYQLTSGAVGCFLSHYTLAKQLLDDKSADYYLILEDDIMVNEKILSTIEHYLSIVPTDWDILQLSTLRNINSTVVGEFFEPSGFWGMQSYIINKKGAKKLVNEVNNHKIDGQIDAYLSRMKQQNKIKIYITKKRLFFINENGIKSDIQCRVIKEDPNENPFNYKGYLV